MNKNLKELNPHSITAVLEPHLQEIWHSTSKEAIFNIVSQVLSDNHINTTASQRLLMKLRTSSNLTNSMFIVSNSILAGKGLAVN